MKYVVIAQPGANLSHIFRLKEFREILSPLVMKIVRKVGIRDAGYINYFDPNDRHDFFQVLQVVRYNPTNGPRDTQIIYVIYNGRRVYFFNAYGLRMTTKKDYIRDVFERQ